MLRLTWLGLSCVVVIVVSPCFLLGANETSAALRGVVFDGAGAVVSSARVRLRHEPTDATRVAASNAAGEFLFEGLSVGGPYEVVTTTDGGGHARIFPIFLGLEGTRIIRVMIGPASASSGVLTLDEVTVQAEREAARGSPGTTALTAEDLEAVPSIERSINDYAKMDPRVVVVDIERGELAAAGQNSRFNAISVDGIRLHDQFGLTPNGLPSQGNPFSMETIEALTVETSPHDASRSGFTGASINAVTRSGSNRFAGSTYFVYRNQDYRAEHPLSGRREPFTDRTYGATLGGPILPRRLFFFLSYEKAERIEASPSPGFEPAPAAIARIVEIARLYGNEAGSFANPGNQHNEDSKYLMKLDWQVHSDHRVTARYSQTQGRQPVFSDFATPDRVSLSGHWYESRQDLKAWSVQLHDRWASAFHSELKVAAHRYDSRRLPRTRFPQVRVNGVPNAAGTDTGSVFLGTDDASQMNSLGVRAAEVAASGTWLGGHHRIQFGAQTERSDFDNTFLQNAYGSYSFASVDAFAAGNPSAFTYQYPLPGQSPTVAWGYAVHSLFVQDTWHARDRLELSAGLRFDYPTVNSRPEYNPLVEQTFGRRNDRTIDGAYVLGPRAGFVWQGGGQRPLRLRGGGGIYQGRAPGVWLSNPYSNDGISSSVNTSIPRFSPDPDNQPLGNPATRRQRVDLVSKGLQFPTVGRATLGLERKLPWKQITASAEVLQTWTIAGLAYRNINLRRTGTGPDGRAIYGDRTAAGSVVSNSSYASSAFTDVYLLENTKRGEATQLTLALRRILRGHWGAALSYTRSRAREVSPATSSTAGTNFSTRASLDPNDDELGTANYEIRDRVLASGTLRYALVKNFPTKVTLLYEGRSGRPYSFIFGSDVNGDSADNLNDLFYVPSGPDDPRVRFADPAQAAAFFDHLEQNPALKRFAGRVAPRNSERSEYQHQVDLKISQQIPITRRFRAELFCDVINLGNLLNSEWGRVRQVNFPYGLIVANASYDAVRSQYIYRYTGAREQSLQTSVSRWQMQSGIRVRF